MGWVRIDDSFYDHPKLIGLDACEIGLWVVMLAWSNRYMTDGILPANAVARFQHDQEPSRLVAAGLWTETADGYEIHDYLDYQPAAESIKERQAKDRVRKKQQGEVESAKAVSSPHARFPESIQDDSARIPRGVPPDSGCPNPTQPNDDSLRSSRRSSTNGKRTKGTRVPDPFQVSDEMAAWAHENIPALDWHTESSKFLDYWRAKPGQAGVKLDWVATWRNWMRTASERAVR